MKTTKLFLVATALVALGLTACKKDDVPPVDGAKATVTVRLFTERSAMPLRGTGNISYGASGTAAERKIHTLQVFLFNGEQPVGDKYFDAVTGREDEDGLWQIDSESSYVANRIETTSGARTMVVIANHPRIDNPLTRTQLINRISAAALTQDIETGGLVMTATVEEPFTLVPGENLYGRANGTHHEGNLGSIAPGGHFSSDANLQLVRINARIALVGLNVKFNEHPTPDTRFDGFELVEVAMFNVRSTSKLFGPNLVNDGGFSYGAAFPSTQDSYQKETLTASLKDAAIPYADIKESNAHYFYVFANTGDPARASKNGTFIVLKGKLLKGTEQFVLDGILTDADGYTYYAIWINDNTLGTGNGKGDNSIDRNTQYNLTVNLYGPGNPTIDPAEDAFLDVHVEVAAWTVIDETVDWGRP
jgi:hypothetical protein